MKTGGFAPIFSVGRRRIFEQDWDWFGREIFISPRILRSPATTPFIHSDIIDSLWIEAGLIWSGIALQHDSVALFAREPFDFLPDFLGDKGHHWVSEPHCRFQHPNQSAAGTFFLCGAGLVVPEHWFG